MKRENKYITEWQKSINKANAALLEGDIDKYENAMNEVRDAYADFKRDYDLTYMCENFGMANYIFEDALPRLFKKQSPAVKEFIKVIKEDKNLRTEFNFFKALERYNDSADAKSYITESLALVNENIDPRTLNESNKKLCNIIARYHIKPSEVISEDKLSLYSDCDYLFKHKKKLSNLLEYNTKINSIVDFTVNNYNTIKESKENPLSLVENFEKKYSSLLNEEEKSLVQEITDWRSEGAEKNKIKLFNKFKNECISAVDKLLGEATSDERDNLLAIKEQIVDKEYCKETVVKDLAKLLEIRDVLNS